MSTLSAAIVLFLVMDPLGNVPLFGITLRSVPAAQRVGVVARELLIALGVMVAFLFAGAPLLGALQISPPALSIAGGVVLFLIALRMVFPAADHGAQELPGPPLVVPLAIPYVAGPSVLATELLLVGREPQRWADWLLALGGAWFASALILLLASRYSAHLGPREFIAMERLMGMLLVVLATQNFLAGLSEYLRLNSGG